MFTSNPGCSPNTPARSWIQQKAGRMSSWHTARQIYSPAHAVVCFEASKTVSHRRFVGESWGQLQGSEHIVSKGRPSLWQMSRNGISIKSEVHFVLTTPGVLWGLMSERQSCQSLNPRQDQPWLVLRWETTKKVWSYCAEEGHGNPPSLPEVLMSWVWVDSK